jgi:hypothetical protein
LGDVFSSGIFFAYKRYLKYKISLKLSHNPEKLNSQSSKASDIEDKEILENLDEDDDPILNLKLTKPFLSSLIQLFGTEEDETSLHSNKSKII